MGWAIGPKRSGGRDSSWKFVSRCKGGAAPPAEISSEGPLPGRSEDAQQPASGQIRPSRTRGTAPASRDRWSNNMAPEARLPCQGFGLSECIPPLPSGLWGCCGETKRKQRSNQPTVCHGSENASLSHDPARRRQIQLQGPIHTSHPCPAAPNQARHSQRAFALFWANSHRQQTSTLTGENLPADPDGRAHFVGFRGLKRRAHQIFAPVYVRDGGGFRVFADGLHRSSNTCASKHRRTLSRARSRPHSIR